MLKKERTRRQSRGQTNKPEPDATRQGRTLKQAAQSPKLPLASEARGTKTKMRRQTKRTGSITSHQAAKRPSNHPHKTHLVGECENCGYSRFIAPVFARRLQQMRF